MKKIINIFILSFAVIIAPFFGQLVHSQTLALGSYTIHVFHPWADDTALNRFGLNFMGRDNWHPGIAMTRTGDLWFSYVYTATQPYHLGQNFTIACFSDPNTNVIYNPIPPLSVESLFSGNPDAREVWVIPRGLTAPPQILFEPPAMKVINFLNPWNIFVPRILNVGDTLSKRMSVDRDRCGWYSRWYFTDDLEQFLFRFVNSTGEASFGRDGDGSQDFIDVSSVLSVTDTVWINTNRDGSVNISATFPRVLGECPFRILTALVRDQRADSISFQPYATASAANWTGENWTGLVTGAVADTLTSDGRIIGLGRSGDARFEHIESWFSDESSPYSTCVDIILTRGEDGWWGYDSDQDGGFFPIDDFDSPNNQPGFRDGGGRERNFHFTMELWMYFEYQQGTNQTFIFRGDDDVWVYTNRVLTFDIGGIHDPIADTVNLDEFQERLGLVDGEVYPMTIFFAERLTSGSNFLIRTNIDFRSSRQLFHNTTPFDGGVVEYDVFELAAGTGLDCGQNSFSATQTPVRAEFILRGPQYREGTLLTSGVNYGGITISNDFTSFIVDTASISGLLPGFYEIIFRDPNDISRTGSIVFFVSATRTAPPMPNPAAGTYQEPVSVSLTSATPNARIFHTTDYYEPFPFNLLPLLDGSDETVIPGSTWRLYTGPIEVDDYLFIRAIAIAPGMQASSVVSFEYIIEIILPFIDRIMLLDGLQIGSPVSLADTIFRLGTVDTHQYYIGLPMNIRLVGVDYDSLAIYDLGGRWYLNSVEMQGNHRDSVPPVLGINSFEYLGFGALKAMYMADRELWDTAHINLRDPVDMITVSSGLFVEQYASTHLNRNNYRSDTIIVSETDFNFSTFASLWFFESDTFNIVTNWSFINLDTQDSSYIPGVDMVAAPRFGSGTYRVEVSRPFAHDSLNFVFYLRVIDMISFGIIPNPLPYFRVRNEGVLYYSNRNIGDITKFKAFIYDIHGNIVHKFEPWERGANIGAEASFTLVSGDFSVSYNTEINRVEVRSVAGAWDGRNIRGNKVNSGAYIVFCVVERGASRANASAYFYYISE